MRAHPMAGDSLVAAVIGLIDVALFVLSLREADPLGPAGAVVPVDIAMVAPIVFRRKYPLTVAYLIAAVAIAHSVLNLGIGSLCGPAIALYTVLVYVGRRQAAYYFGVLVVVNAAQLPFTNRDDVGPTVVVLLLSLALCWVLGEFVGARRAYHNEVEARLHLLETERDQAARIAVAEERSRIARELHDVVAHAVSVMVVQADGASYAIETNPALAERAVQTISKTGRGALAELRRLLDVLRSETSAGEPRVPQPGVDALAELAERVRSAGVPVRVDLPPSLGDLPTGVSLGIYRIVQESLTNTLKHAGRGATAEVRVRREGGRVLVEVDDDGAGRTSSSLVPSRGALPGGNGLIGMRERAHVFGGDLEVGPGDTGGWRVRASIPVEVAQ
ncbi:sensor histidine kinase [Amycolatopsis sp. CA-230715]|uniref:sensor histidine kinase n=1 Tax=Amycolatopsis sp. CA-230715 TaxID=2745196 RepID=UPI003FA493DD